MTYGEFQEWWEKNAKVELQHFDAMPVLAIVDAIRAGRLGEFYQIWRSLAQRARPDEANDLLLSFLSSQAEYLHRNHCAAALIQINHLTEWQPEELSASSVHPVAKNLEKVRERLGGV